MLLLDPTFRHFARAGLFAGAGQAPGPALAQVHRPRVAITSAAAEYSLIFGRFPLRSGRIIR